MIRHALLVFGPLLIVTLTCCPVPASAQEPSRGVLSRVAPEYPELAKRMRVAGTVVIAAIVRPDGTVVTTKVQSGHALLSTAAETAVRKWHFSGRPLALCVRLGP